MGSILLEIISGGHNNTYETDKSLLGPVKKGRAGFAESVASPGVKNSYEIACRSTLWIVLYVFPARFFPLPPGRRRQNFCSRRADIFTLVLGAVYIFI